MTHTQQPSATVAGVDEAGRGPLAGPVAVAAVVLDPDQDWSQVDDSKRLNAAQRDELSAFIRERALSFQVLLVDVATIDRMNILQATLWGMRQVVESLAELPGKVLIDGNQAPPLAIPTETIVGGDASEKCIGAASILAKSTRDAYMCELETKFPGYGFAEHKGYPTPAHFDALRQLGPTPEHRRSFAPVREQLQGRLFE